MRSTGRAVCIGWLFTINNPTPEEKPTAEGFPELKRLVYQLERGAEGTPHYQGFMELTRKMRATALHKIPWLRRAHFEIKKGRDRTPRAMYKYCTKEVTRVDGPWMIGDWSDLESQKKSSLLDSACADILAGKKLKKIARELPSTWCRYHKGLISLHNELAKDDIPIWRPVEVLVLHGETHLGKSRYAIDLAIAYTGDKDDFYVLDASNNSTTWFDGYEGQSVLIIDDFGGYIKYRHLLRILDGYKVRLEIKGGFVWASYSKVIITTNLLPDEWYKKAGEFHDLSPLFRRVRQIVTVDQVLYDDMKAVMLSNGNRFTHRGCSLEKLEEIKARWIEEGRAKREPEVLDLTVPAPMPLINDTECPTIRELANEPTEKEVEDAWLNTDKEVAEATQAWVDDRHWVDMYTGEDITIDSSSDTHDSQKSN